MGGRKGEHSRLVPKWAWQVVFPQVGPSNGIPPHMLFLGCQIYTLPPRRRVSVPSPEEEETYSPRKNSLNQGFSTAREHSELSRGIFVCHDSLSSIGISWVEARDAVYPAIHKTAPTTKNYPAPNISGAEVGKPCFKP